MTQKEKFEELYNSIIASRNTKNMQVLGCMTKKIMNTIIDTHPQMAEEMLNVIEAVNWDNYLTEKEAEQIITNMKPQPKWTKQLWKNNMTILDESIEKQPSYNKCALYVTMCMIDSDDGETLKKLVPDESEYFKLVYNLAVNKLTDKDGVFDIRHYFCEKL